MHKFGTWGAVQFGRLLHQQQQSGGINIVLAHGYSSLVQNKSSCSSLAKFVHIKPIRIEFLARAVGNSDSSSRSNALTGGGQVAGIFTTTDILSKKKIKQGLASMDKDRNISNSRDNGRSNGCGHGNSGIEKIDHNSIIEESKILITEQLQLSTSSSPTPSSSPPPPSVPSSSSSSPSTSTSTSTSSSPLPLPLPTPTSGSSMDSGNGNNKGNNGLVAKLRPYYLLARMDRPIGSLLLFWPSAWALTFSYLHFSTLAASTATTTAAGVAATTATALVLTPGVYLHYMAIFLAGSVLMRSAACIVNDMLDVKYDRQVARTRFSRPLANGTVTRMQAVELLAVVLSAGFLVLVQLNNFSVLLGMCCLPLVVIYPLMKRITHLPQVFLGLTLNYGVLIGWSAISGNYPPLSSLANESWISKTSSSENLIGNVVNSGTNVISSSGSGSGVYDIMERLTTSVSTIFSNGDIAFGGSNFDLSIVLPLYTATILWTVMYDTIYAHQDKVDDARIGVKSTALLFGDRFTKPVLYTCAALTIALLVYAGYRNGFAGPLYYGGLLTAGTYTLMESIYKLNLNDPKSCWRAYSKSNRFGLLVLLLIFTGNLV